VIGVDLATKRVATRIHRDGHVLRSPLADQALEHRDRAVGRVCRLAAGILELGDRVVGTQEVAREVDEVEHPRISGWEKWGAHARPRLGQIAARAKREAPSAARPVPALWRLFPSGVTLVLRWV